MMMFPSWMTLSCQHTFLMLSCTFKEIPCLALSSLVNFRWKRCACEGLEFGECRHALRSTRKIWKHLCPCFLFLPVQIQETTILIDLIKSFGWTIQRTATGCLSSVLTRDTTRACPNTAKTWHDFPLGKRYEYYKHSNSFRETNKIMFSWSIKGTNPGNI